MHGSTGNQAAEEFLCTKPRTEPSGDLALTVWEPPVSCGAELRRVHWLNHVTWQTYPGNEVELGM